MRPTNFLHSSKGVNVNACVAKEFTEYKTDDGQVAYYNKRTGEGFLDKSPWCL